MAKYSVNKYFFKKWSAPMAWVLGVIYSDGTISNYNNRGGRIRIGMQDLDVLDKIKMAMESNHPIKKRIMKGFGGKYSWYWLLDIYNNKLYNDLIEIGLTPAKSLTVKFPEIPKIYLSHFIRGYVDGNGCIYNNKYGKKVEVASGSFEFLEGLKRVVDENEFKCHLQKREGRMKNSHRANISPSTLFLNWLYFDHNGFCMERKYNKYIN